VNRLPEEIFYLLLTGELPDKDSLDELRSELVRRRQVPDYVWDVLRAMPSESHPMTMLSTGLLVMQTESVFQKRYKEGLQKSDYWRATLEDALVLVARVPVVAAGIYRLKYHGGKIIAPDPSLDMSHDLTHMLGLADDSGELSDLLRLYLVLHCDHESGNVSALTTAAVNSALSDLYYALSAGLNGLAGHLHGLANQECLQWILNLMEKFGGNPTSDDVEKHVWDTLKAGRVVPGYGHAVLRITDPRFTAFLEFGRRYCKEEPLFETVVKVFERAPSILRQLNKIKDPWPNVDAISGSLLYHYGLTQLEFYTVLFGVSRAMGVCAQSVIARAMGYPILRPKSVTTEWIKSHLGG
jgi:citrate synthase